MSTNRHYGGPSCTIVLVFRDPIPKGLQFSLSVHQRTHATNYRSHDGPSRTTFLVVRDPIPKDLHLFLSVLWWASKMDRHTRNGLSCTTILVVTEPYPKGLQLFLSVLWRASMTERHTLDGSSCTTVMTVKDPCPKGLHTFSKCPTTNIDDGPSLSWRSILLSLHKILRLSFRVIHINIVLCNTWRTPWGSVVLTTSCHLVHRVSLLLQKCHFIFALIFNLCHFFCLIFSF